ncbi:MAG: DUF4252 domain-containing protein [Crocinitomix sp.]|nr:DUF4252 domain-containing protein [Crocinitomix sp.]
MEKGRSKLGMLLGLFGIVFSAMVFATPINDYYKAHKNDIGMEAKAIPPKMASLMLDDDYEEAIDVLQSLSSLKYLNYSGDQKRVKNYANQATSAKGKYSKLLVDDDGKRKVSVYGVKKRGTVRKIIGIVETKSQFVLILGKGKLSEQQIKYLPMLAKEL